MTQYDLAYLYEQRASLVQVIRRLEAQQLSTTDYRQALAAVERLIAQQERRA